MINSEIILNELEYIEYKGKKFPLIQPKVKDYIKYLSMDFSYKEGVHESEEQPFFENMVYLYNFFGIDKKYADLDIFTKLDNKLSNINQNKKEHKKEINENEMIVEDVDIVYMISKFVKFYGYKHFEVLEMPTNLFFNMYEKINVLNAEEEMRLSELYSLPSYLKTKEGVELINRREESKKKTIMSVYKIKNPEQELSNLEKFERLRCKLGKINIGDVVKND